VITITAPIAVAAATKPTRPMSATHSGVKTRPPMLAPLYAVARAAGRARSNHGATIALTAAAPIATQPHPVRRQNPVRRPTVDLAVRIRPPSQFDGNSSHFPVW
jgi:hypothetical protein